MEATFISLTFLFPLVVAWFLIFTFKSAKSQVKCAADNIAMMKTIPILGHLHYFSILPRKGADRMSTTMHILYCMGKIFRDEDMYYIKLLHKKLLVLTTAESAEALLTSREQIQKSDFYMAMKSSLGKSVFIGRAGDSYVKRKRIMSEVFHNSNMVLLEENLKRNAMKVINNITQLDGTSRVDVSELYTRYTFNNALELCLRAKFSDEFSENIAHHIERYIKGIGERIAMPWLRLDFLFNLTSLGKENKEIFKWMSDRIKEYYESSDNIENNADYLSIFDTIKNSPKKSKYWNTFTDEVQDIITVIFAAFDTSRNTLEWATFLVGHYPLVQAKIQKELADIFGTKEETITWENISKLKYLKCVVKETLRLYPAAPIIGRKLVKDMQISVRGGDCVIAGLLGGVCITTDGSGVGGRNGSCSLSPETEGKTVRKGTDVAVLITLIQRNERHFENPDMFHPERFESDDIPTFAFIPFSYGIRNCMGKAFGYKILMTALAHIFFRFSVKSLDREDSIFTTTSILQRAHKPIFVEMTSRQ